MAETAAHLVDHVFPLLPVRQWVLSVPKRLRWYLEREPQALSAVLRILLRGVRSRLSCRLLVQRTRICGVEEYAE